MSLQKAGAIILSQQMPHHVVLLYRKAQNDWSFPKGKIESGEDALQAMRRETLEETGLSLQDVITLPTLSYADQKNQQMSLAMFLGQSQDDSQLKPEHDGDVLNWIAIDEVCDRLTYENLREYFQTSLPSIHRWIAQRSVV